MAQQFTATVSLTTDVTTVAPGFRPTYLRIDATTLNTAFLNFSSTVLATTASSLGYPFTSGSSPLVLSVVGADVNGMSSQFTAVSSSGGTTVIRVLAIRI